MKTLQIYLGGKMAGLSSDEMNGWREQFIKIISPCAENYNVKLTCVNPCKYYNFEEVRYHSEREVMEFDLYNLRNSNLVVVNFNDVKSIGTAMELMLAKEYHIPVIGFGVNGQKIHPWLLESCTRVCDSLREVVEHVAEFYLN